jgi:hypothetical protein
MRWARPDIRAPGPHLAALTAHVARRTSQRLHGFTPRIAAEVHDLILNAERVLIDRID